MSLREIVESDSVSIGRHNVCAVAKVAVDQPDLGVELGELIEESRSGGVTLAAIRRALLSSGVQMNVKTLSRHRNGECRCGR